MLDLLDIGQTIKRLRREAGITREQLAVLSDVSRARIEALENQRAPDMGYNAVSRLLRALGHDLMLTTFNRGRPTADDLRRENEEIEAARRRRPTKLER
jgi:transcriptional regulator with XRE-family HTH domain